MEFITRAAVNNAILDPLQGFDCDVYVQDQATGKQLIIGRFTSFQFTVRNATEPYMEFNQRVARLLDGEFQFGWVLERGLIDTRFLEDTFGIMSLSREQRISRSPRFQITVELNAPELANPIDGKATEGAQELMGGEIVVNNRVTRAATGKYRLVYAKTDSFTFGAMAGRNVIATRWEGLCEGIYYSNQADIWPGQTLGKGVSVNSNSPTSKTILTGRSLSDTPGSAKGPEWDIWGSQLGEAALPDGGSNGIPE
jgi:hypothetical protein